MSKKLIITLIAMLLPATMFSLNPVKTAISYTGGGSVNISIEVHEIGGTGNPQYSETIGSRTANSSGTISFFIGVNDQGWTNLDPSDVDGQWVVNISLDGSLYTQQRLDGLIEHQAISGASDTDFPNGDDIGDLSTKIVFQAQAFTTYDGDDLHPDHPDGTIVYLYSTTDEGIFQDAEGHVHAFDSSFSFTPELTGPGVTLMKHSGNWYIVGQTYRGFGGQIPD